MAEGHASLRLAASLSKQYDSLMGEAEVVLDCFEMVIESGFGTLEWIDPDTDFDRIRDHPRFQAARAKIT